MSKKRKTIVPQFGTVRTPGRPFDKNVQAPAGSTPHPAPRVKPPATTAKSGRRGG